jgi:glycerol uptake facilitator-like aquaporin
MNGADHRKAEICFFERDPRLALARRTAVETIGSLLLMFAATGSGLMATKLLHDSPALGLIMNALATSGALVGLILAFGPVSGGHYNPLISGLQWLSGERTLKCALSYIVGQIAGAVVGAVLARFVFDMAPPTAITAVNWRLVLSEIIASAGLMIVVFGSSRAGRGEAGPFAVGAWLTAAIICAPSGSYANPAIAIGALFAAGPITLQNGNLFAYLPAEVFGGLIALLIVSYAYGEKRTIE